MENNLDELEELKFTIKGDNGEDIECDAILTFDLAETGKSYMLYTFSDEKLNKDEDGNVKVLVGVFEQDGESTKILPIETEEEWEQVAAIYQEIMNELAQNINAGDEQ